MIIECPSCRARYRLDEGRIPDRGAKVRCRRCGDRIVVRKEDPASPPAPPPDPGRFDLRSSLGAGQGHPGVVIPPDAWPEATQIPPDIGPAPPGDPGDEPAPPPPSLGEAPREAVPLEGWFPEREGQGPGPGEGEDTSLQGLLTSYETQAAAAMDSEGPGPPDLREPAGPFPALGDLPGESSPESPAEDASRLLLMDEPLDLPGEPQAPPGEPAPLRLMVEEETQGFLRKEGNAARFPPSSLDLSASLRPDPTEPGTPESSVPRPDSLEGDRADSYQAELSSALAASQTGQPPAADPLPPPRTEGPSPAAPAGRAAPFRPVSKAAPKRRGGRLALLLLVLALAGGAFLGFTEGGRKAVRGYLPEPVSRWIGAPPEGALRYGVENLAGYYDRSSEAGRLFVVRGTLTNQTGRTRSGIRVQAILLGTGGSELVRRTAYAGNLLRAEALRRASREELERKMANRFGDAMANVEIPPGGRVPFLVVFPEAPEGVMEFRVEPQDGE